MNPAPIVLLAVVGLTLPGCFLIGSNTRAAAAANSAGLTATLTPTVAAAGGTITSSNTAGAGLSGFVALEDGTTQLVRLDTSTPFTTGTLTLANGSTVALVGNGAFAQNESQASFTTGTRGIDLTSIGYSQGFNAFASIETFFLNDVRGYASIGVQTDPVSVPTTGVLAYDTGVTIFHARNSNGEDGAGELDLQANFDAGTFTMQVDAGAFGSISGTGTGTIVGNQLAGAISITGTVGAATPISGTADVNGGFFGDAAQVVQGVAQGTDDAVGGAGGTFTAYWGANR